MLTDRFVTAGSYIVAMDGIMEQLMGAARTQPDWTWNNPRQAALEFASTHPDFVIEEPHFMFNEGAVKKRVTYWLGPRRGREEESKVLRQYFGK